MPWKERYHLPARCPGVDYAVLVTDDRRQMEFIFSTLCYLSSVV
jgi:hypothetical protein